MKPYLPITKLEDCLAESQKQPVMILKHSKTCPISSHAKAQVDRYLKEGTAPVYLVVVQKEHPLSQEIADQLKIKHESPQLIILRDGAVHTFFNHYQIEEETIRRELAK